MRRVGNASTLAILQNDLYRRLFLANAVDFGVRIDCAAFDTFPQPQPLALPRGALEVAGGGMLNTCNTATLEETLRHLKRAFWPCAWDTSLDPPAHNGVGSQGGFR